MKNVKELGHNQVELTIKIEKPVFDEAVMQAYKKNVGKIQVPGFRKGKAPKSIIEKMYGTSFFYEDALDAILPEIYSNAVEKAKLDVVSRPEIDISSVDENGVVLTAKVYVKPVATVSEYKGLEAEKEEVVVTEEDIDNEILATRKRNSRTLTVTDRPAENDDEVVIDFEGFLDGVAFEGGKAEKQNLKLGSGSFIPGFEEQIIGHNIGEKFDITVKFPEDYHAENLKGKEAVFKIVLHEIKKIEIPELDDDFVKEVSDTFETVADYRADVKAKITERKTKANDRAFEEKLIDALLAKTEVEIPEAMIESEIDAQVRDFEYRLQSQGLDLATYCRYLGIDEKGMRDNFREQAERQVKARLALEAVVKAEAVVPTAEEIKEEYKKIAEMYGIEESKVKESVPRESVSEDLAIRKAVEIVKENAVVKAPAPKAEEPKTEKKTTAKKTTAKKESSEKSEPKTAKTTKKAKADNE